MKYDPMAIAVMAAILDSSDPFKPNLLYTTTEAEMDSRAARCVDRALRILDAAHTADQKGGAS